MSIPHNSDFHHGLLAFRVLFGDSGIDPLDRGSVIWFLAALAIQSLYFAVSESVWGATIGKRLCRLRGVGREKQPPTFPRALLRAVVLFVTYQLHFIVLYLALTPREQLAFMTTPIGQIVNFAPYVLLALLFSTARRKNGFAGVHELVSSTRVVTRLSRSHRPESTRSQEVQHPPTGRRVGPYEVFDDSNLNDAARAIGYDDKLRRSVWIRRSPIGSPAVPPTRRDLGRVTRLRWLAGTRTADESWDAYEAPEGRPLLTLLSPPIGWQAVRHWLHDLAAELHAGLQDQSLPELGLDRVWITPDGGARLLDWPAPGLGNAGQSASFPRAPDLDSAQQFLHRVARTALEGHPYDAASDSGTSRALLPVPAITLLHSLQTRTFQTPQLMVRSVGSVLRGPAFVSKWRRAVHLMVCGSFPVFVGSFALLGMFVIAPMFESSEFSDFMAASSRLASLEQEESGGSGLSDEQVQEREALEIYIASRFGGWLAEPSNATVFELAIVEQNRELLERVVAAHPSPSAEAVSEATKTVESLFERQPTFRPVPAFGEMSGPDLLSVFWFAWLVPWIPVVVAALVSAAGFRGGLALRLSGIAIVTRAGAEASRLRSFGRALLAWAPLYLSFVLLAASPATFRFYISSVMGLLFLVAAIWAVVNPARGLQDRIAGTYLVPR